MTLTDAQTGPSRATPRKARIGSLALLVGLSLAAGAVGSALGGSMPSAWYQQLEKPAYNPPGWVFAPVWTTLYVLMGVAAWLVWKRRQLTPVSVPMTLFGLQLVLNAIWSWLFFGLQSPAAGLTDLVILWGLILAMAITFWRVSRPAGILILPYIAWVSFAGVLNTAILVLN